MKVNIKFEALSVLMTGLKDTQMWVIYQMASGKNLPDSVTKMDLLKIIIFLFKQLDWIEDKEDSIEPDSATINDTEVTNHTQDTANGSIEPFTSISSGNDDQVIFSSRVSCENPIFNVSEVNERYNERTETQQLGKRIETDVNSALYSIQQEYPSNDEMEVQNDAHPKENNSNVPSSIASIINEHQETFEGAENNIPNETKNDKNIEEAEHQNQGTEIDVDKSIDSLHERTTPLEYDLSYSCLKCDKKFSNERNLAAHDFLKHQSSIDINEKLLSNSRINTSFKRDSENHERIYSGEKTFSCSQYDFFYRLLMVRKKHYVSFN